jgi:hypothetical protein
MVAEGSFLSNLSAQLRRRKRGWRWRYPRHHLPPGLLAGPVDRLTPWLPVNPDYTQRINVAEQMNDPDSLLSLYKKMLHIRKANPALICGDYQGVFEESTDFLTFLRTAPQQKCLVILNMSEMSQSIQFNPGLKLGKVNFTSRTGQNEDTRHGSIQLAPYEVFITEVI